MIALTSNGLSSKPLIKHLKTVCNERRYKTAVLVTTADNVYKEDNYHTERLTHELKQLNLTVTLFDYNTDDVEILTKTDVIEFNGGNPYYLLDRIRSSNSEKFIERFSKTNILIGMSAGSLVIQKDLNLINQLTPEMNFLNLTNINTLNLVDIEILPHWNKLEERLPNIHEVLKKYNNEVITLNESEGIIID